jgi:glycine hydroxymethyltransferase
VNGLRLGVPEIVRLGMDAAHMPQLAGLIAQALRQEPETVAGAVTDFRRGFQGLHYMIR